MARKGHKTEYRQWTPEDISWLIELYPSMKNEELEVALGRSVTSIQHKATRLGLKKTADHLYKVKSERCQERAPGWKGGKSISRKGYVVLNVHNGKKFEHRAVMEEYLGRPLAADEVVHHINGDKTDNRIENLQLMTNAEHTIMHHTGAKRTAEAKAKMRKARLRRVSNE